MVASYIEALLHKDGIHWNNGGSVGKKGDMVQSATVTYSFMNGRPPGLSQNHYKNFTRFSLAQQSQIRKALEHYEDVANVRFQYRSSGGTLQLGYADTFYDFDGDGDFEPAGGLATRPNSSGSRIVIDRDIKSFSPGSSGYTTFLHELGHAVGGFNDVTMGRNPGDKYPDGDEKRNRGMNGRILSSWQDSDKYTVMSYIGHPDMPGVQPRTLMLYDMAALQTLYGPNWNHNAGHNTYSWGRNETFVETLWDGGGIDTIDASNQTRRSYIDLRAGRFSSIGSYYNRRDAKNNFAIAYRATIENAKGGSGSDTILGNNVRNILIGNAGNDYIRGDGGDDYMDGGTGIDTVDYQYWKGGGRYNLGTGIASFSGYYSEEIRNFENIKTGAGRDIISGSAANNRIEAGAGNDWISAGAGNDYLLGGSGHDYLVGGIGNDLLVGGTGADQFRFNNLKEGIDRITDFLQIQGDKIQISASGFGGNLAKGVLGASQFVMGAATDASDRFLYNRSTGALSFDIDGSGARAAVQFATLSAGTTLTSDGIVVV